MTPFAYSETWEPIEARGPEAALEAFARNPQLLPGPAWAGAWAWPHSPGYAPSRWLGGIVWDVDPHPLALGRLVWRVLRLSQWSATKTGSVFHQADATHTAVFQDFTFCSRTCRPEVFRWVYVLRETGLAVATTIPRVASISDEITYQHEYVGYFPYRNSEPDWRALATSVLEMKRAAGAPASEWDCL